MNKEVIKKYKAEFNWWLNGGTLLIKMNAGWTVLSEEYSWHLAKELIVINDEYVELRKALAEGKTIQYKNKEGVWWDDDVLNFSEGWEYRIKPNEIEFKVGNYVVYENDSYLLLEDFNDSFLATNRTNIPKLSALKLWTLKEASDDEWVLVIGETYGKKDIRLTTAKETKTSSGSEYVFDIIPYIGQTPKQLGLEK